MDLTFGWLRGARPLLLAIVIGLLALLTALWVGANERPATTLFEPGTLAFSRDGDLFVAAPDGLAITRIADGQPANDISKFAFSPDRRYLAFVTIGDAATSAETLDIVTSDGSTRHLYTGGGLTFGWAPDGTRLAVYPGNAANEIAIIDIAGNRTGALELPDGGAPSTSWFNFGSLTWSPDSIWLAAAVSQGGTLSNCPTINNTPATTSEADTCYILLAADGSGARGSSDELSNYLAWAPDSRVALTHWYTKTVEIRALDGSAPIVVDLPTTSTTHDYPLTMTNDGHVLAWSPDGTQLVVAGYDKWTHRNTLVVIDGDGSARTVQLDDSFNGVTNPSGFGTGIDAVAWSVDGERLLFQGAKSGSSALGIWSVLVDGGSPSLIVEETGPLFDQADGRPW